VTGGTAVSGLENARAISEDDAEVSARWTSASDDHQREFLLFVASGILALGLAAALEAVKAFIEQSKTAREEPVA
jgi:hypothetical protein